VQYRLLLPVLTLLLSGCGGGDSPPAEYTVTSQGSANGLISPSKVMVKSGESTRFTLLPMANYVVDKVSGCNGSLQGQTYITGAITAPCVVNVSFALQQYTLSTKVSIGGSVTPMSSKISRGERGTLQITPELGYVIESVSGCNGTLEDNIYTTALMLADCEVAVNFVSRQVNVTMQVGEGGKASISSNPFVLGAPLDVVFTPNSGYVLTDASGCGGLLRDNTLKIKALKENCSIKASFHPERFVVFADDNLDRKVRDALGEDSQRPLTQFDVSSIGYLDAGSANIVNLRGIEQLSGLRKLRLSTNDITDLYPLQKLTRLVELDLTYNANLSDISPLTELKRLEHLRLGLTKVADLSSLTGLPLQYLDISFSKVIDLSPLRDAPLTTFVANDTSIADLTAIANKPFKELYIDYTLIDDIRMLSNLTNLRVLSARDTAIDDVNVVKKAKELDELALSGTKMLDLDVLSQLGFTERSELSISGCLDLKGYSKHLVQLNQLAKSKNMTVLTNGPQRTDCPNTLQHLSFLVDGSVTDRQLSYNWQIIGRKVEMKCAAFVNMEDQYPETSADQMEDCEAVGERIYKGLQADQFHLSLLFDNGIGGEHLVRMAVGKPPATPKLQSMDLSQITLSSRPLLVPQREGLLRLHVTAAQNPEKLPTITVLAARNGATESLTARPPVAIPTEKVHRSLNQSYQVIIPAALMQKGLELTALMDGQVVQRLTPTFAEQRQLSLRMVPLQLGDQVATLPDPVAVERNIKTFWPISDVTVRARAPYQLKSSTDKVEIGDMLDQIHDLRMIEGEKVYYYGYYNRKMSNDSWSGMGFIGLPAAVGIDTDTDGSTLAHELGHNFGRRHVDCGGPASPDGNYPYAGDSLGSVGLSLELNELKLPGVYKDIMSYCRPRHVSDYNVAAVQQFLQINPPAAFAARQADLANATGDSAEVALNRGASLYIAGQLQGDNLEIRTMLPLSRLPQLVTVTPELRLTARVQDVNGRWSTHTAQLLQYGHGDSGARKRFMLEIPTMSIAQLELWQQGRLLGRLAMTNAVAPTVSAAASKPSAAAPTLSAAAHATDSQHNPVMRADLVSQIKIVERSNEVCVDWPATGQQTLSLMHQAPASDESNGTTVLALNETQGNFCRSVTELPSGGTWRLVWREQLTMREFRQQR